MDVAVPDKGQTTFKRKKRKKYYAKKRQRKYSIILGVFGLQNYRYFLLFPFLLYFINKCLTAHIGFVVGKKP